MLKIKIKETLLIYLIIWFVAGLNWFLIGPRFEFLAGLPEWKVLSFILGGNVVMGFFCGLFYLLLERFAFRRVSVPKLFLIMMAMDIGLAIVFIPLFFTLFSASGIIEPDYTLLEFITDPIIRLAFLYGVVVNIAAPILIEVNYLLGPGNLLRLIRGEYYMPKESERIFMFLDLRSSTAIAEKLGHVQYSRFIQDCFYDLSVVQRYGAEIHQYVGDEAVLTWRPKQGLSNANCIRAFYAFCSRLHSKKSQYIERYGIMPDFKAGINIGSVMIAEIGDRKRDIAYHGDAINTAARIQSMCNELGEQLLVSDSLLKQLELPDSYLAISKGDYLLKGKKNELTIHAVRKPSRIPVHALPAV